MSDHAKRLHKCCEESDTVGTTQYSYSSDTEAPVDIFASSSSSSSSQDSPTGSSYISYKYQQKMTCTKKTNKQQKTKNRTLNVKVDL